MDNNKPKMTLTSVVAMGIGSMLGAGIFALLGQVVLQAGSHTYISFAFAGIVALLSGYSYSKLAKLYPDSGGITEYYGHAFNNRFFAGVFSFIYLATLCISIAMLGQSFGIYAIALFKIPHEVGYIFSVGIIVIVGIFNIRGAANVGKAETILVALKLSVLIALLAMTGYRYIWIEKPSLILHTSEPISFWKSVSFAFFAYAGYGIMTNAAGDVKNPKRTIPWAIFIAISVVLVLYISLAFVVMNYVETSALQKDVDTAIALAANAIMGKYGFLLISLAALVALLSGINALFFSSFKIMTDMSLKKEFPAFLSKTLVGKATWGMTIIITSMAFSSYYFKFHFIALLASSSFLVSYIAVFIANFMLSKKTDSSRFLILLGLILMSIIFIQSLIN